MKSISSWPALLRFSSTFLHSLDTRQTLPVPNASNVTALLGLLYAALCGSVLWRPDSGAVVVVFPLDWLGVNYAQVIY